MLVAGLLVWVIGSNRVTLHARKRLGRFNRLTFDLESRHVPFRDFDEQERRWWLLLVIVAGVLILLGMALMNGAFL